MSIQPWFRSSEGNHNLPLLLCFPWAGGAASDFVPLVSCLRNSLEVQSVHLPGRGKRSREPMPSTLEALAESFVDDTMRVLTSRRVWLFGHSMGADLAMLVAHSMERRLQASPERVVLSALGGPIIGQMRGTSHHWSEEDFYEFLRTDPRIPMNFFEPKNLSVLGPRIRRDYACSDAHVYCELRPLRCPITALAGVHDDISTEELQRWRPWTLSTFRLRLMPGGHGSLQTHPLSIARILLEEIQKTNVDQSVKNDNKLSLQ